MREAKFRAWYPFGNKWVTYGTAIQGSVDYLQLDKETEGQYIETLNGTDVYTGDIIEYDECVADYRYVTQRVVAALSSDFLGLLEWHMEEYFKVIGNIHQNLELLEQV